MFFNVWLARTNVNEWKIVKTQYKLLALFKSLFTHLFVFGLFDDAFNNPN